MNEKLLIRYIVKTKILTTVDLTRPSWMGLPWVMGLSIWPSAARLEVQICPQVVTSLVSIFRSKSTWVNFSNICEIFYSIFDVHSTFLKKKNAFVLNNRLFYQRNNNSFGIKINKNVKLFNNLAQRTHFWIFLFSPIAFGVRQYYIRHLVQLYLTNQQLANALPLCPDG